MFNCHKPCEPLYIIKPDKNNAIFTKPISKINFKHFCCVKLIKQVIKKYWNSDEIKTHHKILILIRIGLQDNMHCSNNKKD